MVGTVSYIGHTFLSTCDCTSHHCSCQFNNMKKYLVNNFPSDNLLPRVYNSMIRSNDPMLINIRVFLPQKELNQSLADEVVKRSAC